MYAWHLQKLCKCPAFHKRMPGNFALFTRRKTFLKAWYLAGKIDCKSNFSFSCRCAQCMLPTIVIGIYLVSPLARTNASGHTAMCILLRVCWDHARNTCRVCLQHQHCRAISRTMHSTPCRSRARWPSHVPCWHSFPVAGRHVLKHIQARGPHEKSHRILAKCTMKSPPIGTSLGTDTPQPHQNISCSYGQGQYVF